ncbi:MAG TPA: hypothetical protein ENJ08_09165 [Gammaproteobacteria bacterium]|nr:hypothetical protein [Gammaproteobacteria bacterium]
MKVLYFIVLLFAVSACSSDKEEKSTAKENTASAAKTASTDKHDSHDDHSHSGAHDDHSADKTAEKEEEKANPYDGIIYIETGAVQCQAQGVTHLETAQLLSDNGIEVLESQCADLSGEGVVIQCGLVGPDINVHTVAPENHARALAMGFKSTSSLKQDDDAGYTVKDCDSLKQQ